MSAGASAGAAALSLRSLTIRRLAGLGDAGFTLDDLSPGINVIFGPNGVGKTRTAWAINLALWPAALARDQRDAVTAAFDIGGDAWLVEVDGDSVRHQRGGVDAPGGPALAGASERDRYNLALADLLSGRDEAFVAAIARESAGGYDLSAAAEELGIGKRPTVRVGQLTQAVQQAKIAVRECERRVEELRERESTLAQLKRDRDAARAAVARADALRAALERLDAAARQAEAEAALASFPPALARVTGQELDQLRQLRKDRDDLADAIAETARQKQEAASQLAESRLDEGSALADETVPATIGEAGRRLAQLTNDIVTQRKSIEAARARQERARAAVGAAADPQRLAVLDPAKLAELAAAAREAELAELHLHALAEQQQVLSDGDGDGAAAEASRLENGLFLLNSWLSEPDAAEAGEAGAGAGAGPQRKRDRGPILLAAAVIVLLSIVLAWRVQWWLALFALLGPAVVWWWGRDAGASPAPQSAAPVRPSLAVRYAALALPIPQWTTEAVRAAARQLSDQLAAAQLRRGRAQRRAELEPALRAARQQCEQLAARRASLAESIGLPVPTHAASLHALAEAVAAWQSADGEVHAAAAALAPLEAERAAMLAAAAGTLQRFGYSATEPHELEAARESLRRRLDQRRLSRERLGALDALAADQSRRAEEIGRRIDSLFAAVGLTGEAEEPALRQYLSQRGEYEAARRAAAVAAARAAELAPGAADAELATRPRAELAAELEAATAAAAMERALSEQIIAIQTQVDAAKRGHELEAAEAGRREAAAKLAEAREQSCAAAIGWALVEHLRQANRDRNRPAVLRSAAEIFARITRGRYRLEFDESSDNGSAGSGGAASGRTSGGFVAIDTQSGAGQPLSQLSAGTRVQLLLAVRVAFVEQQERGPRLPLLLDETLANSDDTRARQVVDAVVEICRGGRQVFYFTAQQDEVSKWREILQPDGSAEPSVPCRFIDLAAVRGWAAAQRTPMRALARAALAPVPEPAAAGMDRAAYGALLAAPGIDPRSELPGSVHLWHLVDELNLLHRLLSRGVSTWGQLQTLQQHGGLAVDGEERAAVDRAGARAKLVEALARAWRIGRGRLLDRAALAAADEAVSAVQLPRVLSVAESVGWDADRLIQQMENRAVPNFQVRKLEQLKQVLTEGGYLDPRPVLDATALRLAGMAAVQRELDAGLLEPAEIEQFQRTWFEANVYRGSGAPAE